MVGAILSYGFQFRDLTILCDWLIDCVFVFVVLWSWWDLLMIDDWLIDWLMGGRRNCLHEEHASPIRTSEHTSQRASQTNTCSHSIYILVHKTSSFMTDCKTTTMPFNQANINECNLCTAVLTWQLLVQSSTHIIHILPFGEENWKISAVLCM